MIKNVFFLIFFSLSSLIASEVDIQIISQSSNSLRLKITFPEPQVIHNDGNKGEKSFSYFYMKGLSLLEEAGYSRVPFLTKMFSLPSEKVFYQRHRTYPPLALL